MPSLKSKKLHSAHSCICSSTGNSVAFGRCQIEGDLLWHLYLPRLEHQCGHGSLCTTAAPPPRWRRSGADKWSSLLLHLRRINNKDEPRASVPPRTQTPLCRRYNLHHIDPFSAFRTFYKNLRRRTLNSRVQETDLWLAESDGAPGT